MDFNEFAESIKAKYPQYKDKDNKTLAEAIISKYPQYKEKVTFEPTVQEAPKFYEIEKQQGLPQTIGEKLAQPFRQVGQALTNPMPGSMLQLPAKIVSENAQQLGSSVAKGLSTPGGALPDIGTTGARIVGIGASVAADPTSYTPLGLTKGIAKPTQVESLTKNAMQSLKNISKEYGDKLNKAKEGVGLPVTKEARADALEKAGNLYNFGKADITEISKKLTKDIPDQAGSVEDFLVSGKGGNKELSGKLKEIRSFVDFDSIKNQDELIVAINRFKRHADDLPDQARVKIASALQEKIQNFVDFTKTGTTKEGLLKGQYSDLASDLIPEALAKNKAEMGDVLKLTSELKNLTGKPGKAEQFLRTMVTGKSAINKDKAVAIRKLEALTGEPIYDNLVKAIEKEGPSLFTQMAKDTPVFGPLITRTLKLLEKAASSEGLKKVLLQLTQPAANTAKTLTRPGIPLREGFPDAKAELEKVRARLYQQEKVK